MGDGQVIATDNLPSFSAKKGTDMKKQLDFRAASPDPRVLLLMSLTVSTLCFTLSYRPVLIAVFLLAAAGMLIFNMGRMAAGFILIYGVVYGFEQLLWRFGAAGELQAALGILLLLLLRFCPVVMAGLMVLRQIRVNELITALEQLRIPGQLTIPLAIVFRYLPTVYQEVDCIRDNLKMRGLPAAPWEMLCRPAAAIEHLLVPLLLRSSRLADELSATALLRGLDLKEKRTSATAVAFRKADWAWCLLCIGLALALLAVDTGIFGRNGGN